MFTLAQFSQVKRTTFLREMNHVSQRNINLYNILNGVPFLTQKGYAIYKLTPYYDKLIDI
jgi:hypothetical protein